MTRQRIRWWMRLNRIFFPVMGPAHLGPFDEAPLPSTAEKPCPLCGSPMSQHTIVRTADATTTTKIHCPKPQAA